MPDTNPFVALCQLANREKWCWNLMCTTCGHMHFHCGFYELSIGRKPGEPDWVTTARIRISEELFRKVAATGPAINLAELYKILAAASAAEVVNSCSFPECLGYLGLALAYTKEQEHAERQLSRHWGQELLDLVMPGSPAMYRLQEIVDGGGLPLGWRDLEPVERDIRSEFRRLRARSLR